MDGRIYKVFVSSTYDDLPDISPEEPVPQSRVALNEKYGEGDTMAREHEQLKGVTDKAGGAIKDGANKQAKKQAGPNLRGRLVHRATIRST